MNETECESGGLELLDEIALLWGNLNRLHDAICPHFREVFPRRTFRDRKARLVAKSGAGRLRVDIARSGDGQDIIGYCASTVDREKTGEIDSLYVEEQYRRGGVGSHLMNAALAWMDGFELARKPVVVASANDEALGFYERVGFYPANFELIQMGGPIE